MDSVLILSTNTPIFWTQTFFTASKHHFPQEWPIVFVQNCVYDRKIVAFSTTHPTIIFNIKNTLTVHMQRLELTKTRSPTWGVAAKKKIYFTLQKKDS